VAHPVLVARSFQIEAGYTRETPRFDVSGPIVYGARLTIPALVKTCPLYSLRLAIQILREAESRGIY
jgi:hypothetical protein